MDIKEEIGARIAEARTAKEWSQVRLATEIGLKAGGSRISNYEQGTRTPDPATMVKLAAALGVAPGVLMFGQLGYSARVVRLGGTLTGKGEEALVATFRLLNKSNRESLIDDAEKYLRGQRPPGKRSASK